MLSVSSYWLLVGEKKQATCFDPFDGLEEQAGDERLDADPRAVIGCLDHEALVFLIARVLPLGNDLDAVADLERFGAVLGVGCFMNGDGRCLFVGRGCGPPPR